MEPVFLDLRGLRCPLPVVRLETALRGLSPGRVVQVLADDPVAAVDIPHFARQAGHACTRTQSGQIPGAFAFEIVCKPA